MKYGNNLTKNESRRKCLMLLNAAIIAGIAAGAVLAALLGADRLAEAKWLHQCFSPLCSGNTVLEVFLNCLQMSGMFIGALFVLGFCSGGQLLCIALLIYRGIGMGAAAAQLYMLLGVSALPAVFVLVLPKAIVLSYITSLAARESLKLSKVQFMLVFSDVLPEEKMQRVVKLYCIKFTVLMIFVILVSAADSLFNYLFLDLYRI